MKININKIAFLCHFIWTAAILENDDIISYISIIKSQIIYLREMSTSEFCYYFFWLTPKILYLRRENILYDSSVNFQHVSLSHYKFCCKYGTSNNKQLMSFSFLFQKNCSRTKWKVVVLKKNIDFSAYLIFFTSNKLESKFVRKKSFSLPLFSPKKI